MPALMFGMMKYGRTVAMAASLVLAVASGSSVNAQSGADDLTNCQREESLPEFKLQSCSNVIADSRQLPEIRADAYLNRGIAQEDLNNLADAIEDYSQAIKLNPEHRALYHYRGLAYDRDGKDDLAIADFTEAIRLDPTDTEALLYRGLIYAAQSDFDKAIADYSTALEHDPENEDALSARGEAREAKGERDLAIADYRRALELDDDNEEALNGLQRLGVSRK